MLTPEMYAIERAICDKAEAYASATRAKRGKGCNFITAEEAAHPDYAACSNEMRGRVEEYELKTTQPDRIFAYLNSDCSAVTVWTGNILGRVHYLTKGRGNFGDWRYYFRVAIAGATYSGVGYGGGGMHCRLRKIKA